MSKRDKILASVFADPVRANIHWVDIESMLKALGATISEGRGSRLRVLLNGVVAVFHRPHPGKEAKRRVVLAVRKFLTNAGARP